MRPTRLIGLLLGTLSLALPVQAQVGDNTVKHDTRVQTLLDARGLTYTIDEDGDFRLTYETEGSRTQLATIRSVTAHYQGLATREIWSVGYRSEREDQTFPADVAQQLLEDTFQNKLGAWGKDGEYAVYVIRVSANADADTLITALEFAIDVADRMEKQLTGDTDAF